MFNVGRKLEANRPHIERTTYNDKRQRDCPVRLASIPHQSQIANHRISRSRSVPLASQQTASRGVIINATTSGRPPLFSLNSPPPTKNSTCAWLGSLFLPRYYIRSLLPPNQLRLEKSRFARAFPRRPYRASQLPRRP